MNATNTAMLLSEDMGGMMKLMARLMVRSYTLPGDQSADRVGRIFGCQYGAQRSLIKPSTCAPRDNGNLRFGTV